MPPAVALLNYMRRGTLSRIFPKLGFFAGFSRYHFFAGRYSKGAMGWTGGAQQPVFRVKEPKRGKLIFAELSPMRIRRDTEESTKTQTQKAHIKKFGVNTQCVPCVVDPNIWVNC
jgi:hypothetical protein